ncbi:hypothetical protein [Streptomyces albospinus]|nr:hypothetical protein [Streptomyces albospinus]
MALSPPSRALRLVVMLPIRANLHPVLARNPNIRITTKVASNHSKILPNEFRAVAHARRELAATRDHTVG